MDFLNSDRLKLFRIVLQLHAKYLFGIASKQ